MVNMKIRDFGQEEWNDVVSAFDDLSLMQTWEYGEAKAKIGPWKVWRAVFCQDDEVVGAAQATIHTIPFLNRGLYGLIKLHCVKTTIWRNLMSMLLCSGNLRNIGWIKKRCIS